MSKSKICWKCGKNKVYSNANLCQECRDLFFYSLNKRSKKQKYSERVGGGHGGSLSRLYCERRRSHRESVTPKYFSETEFDAAKEKYLYHDREEFCAKDVAKLVGVGRIVSKKKRDVD